MGNISIGFPVIVGNPPRGGPAKWDIFIFLDAATDVNVFARERNPLHVRV